MVQWPFFEVESSHPVNDGYTSFLFALVQSLFDQPFLATGFALGFGAGLDFAAAFVLLTPPRAPLGFFAAGFRVALPFPAALPLGATLPALPARSKNNE
jgi:hypothetical protein